MDELFHRLFIIGNGFDSAHNYETRYVYFRNWMENKLKEAYPQLEVDGEGHIIINDDPLIPFVTFTHHGEEVVDEKQSLYMLMWLLINNTSLDDEWNEFESALHNLDLDAIIDLNDLAIEDNARDREGDINPFHADVDYEEMASNLKTSVMLLPKLFNQWIEDIDITKGPRLALGEKMDEYSLYLTFNYTETLEKVYDIPGYLVDHIHGLRLGAERYYSRNSSFPNTVGKIIVGHGNDLSREFNSEYINREIILQETIRELRKPVDRLIKEHSEFWSYIFYSEIKEVYSFGFSFANVDIPYINQIVISLKYGENAIWYLNKYDDEPDKYGKTKNDKFERVIKSCGFKGVFGRYE